MSIAEDFTKNQSARTRDSVGAKTFEACLGLEVSWPDVMSACSDFMNSYNDMKKGSIKKQFFHNNKLNKGYAENTEHAKKTAHHDKIEEMLPPIEVLAAYEEAYPETITKLLEMAKKEQEHRHSIEVFVQRRQDEIAKFFVAVMTILSISSIILGLMVDKNTAGIFAVSGFSCTYIMFRMCYNNLIKRSVQTLAQESKKRPEQGTNKHKHDPVK